MRNICSLRVVKLEVRKIRKVRTVKFESNVEVWYAIKTQNPAVIFPHVPKRLQTGMEQTRRIRHA